MRNGTSKVHGLIVLVAVALLLGLTVACSSDETNGGDGSSGTIEIDGSSTDGTTGGDGLSGTIEIDGSSTVGPISEAVAEEFSKIHPDVHANVSISGTGGGFKRFTVGETDISNASRPIKDSEAEQAQANNIEYIELTVALDGLAVMVSKENTFVDCLTVEELNMIWKPGSEVNNWNQVRSSFPDERIRLYGPDTDSGTFDYFTDEINGDEGVSRDDYTASADDNVLVQGISGDTNALGYFGYAYYAQNEDKLKVIGVDGGNGCVTPSDETVSSGTYSPLSRPIFIYVNTEKLKNSPELQAFVDYYLENTGELASQVGYTALTSYASEKVKVRAVLVGLSGTIEIDGSSTVGPISEAVAEEFSKIHPDVHANVSISGTGGGFKRFTVGETDISNASRPIKDSEAEQAQANNIEYIELTVALDGLAVMVSKENTFVDCLTVEELNMIWKPGSEVNNWNQVRSSFPDERIRLYGPDTDSGTFDYFTDEINGDEGVSRDDYTASADDNVLVQGISGDTNALGYFGYAYYAQNEDKLKVIGVDGGNGCVTPSDETVSSGTYSPLSRPIFIYVNTEKLKNSPELQAFVDYYLENTGELASQVGYTALTSYASEKVKVRAVLAG